MSGNMGSLRARDCSTSDRSRDSVAFEYAGDLWLVARKWWNSPTTDLHSSFEIDPYFSPDGSQIAFTATVAGNTDVYVVPSSGGDPKRLTYHPGLDRVRGWKPDGKSIVFASNRTGAPQQSYMQLWTISRRWRSAGDVAAAARILRRYSPDGTRLAFEEFSTPFIPEWYETSMWRHYRGGRTHPISVMNLADHSVKNFPGPTATIRFSDVGRQHDLLPFRSQSHRKSVCLSQLIQNS